MESIIHFAAGIDFSGTLYGVRVVTIFFAIVLLAIAVAAIWKPLITGKSS